MNSLERSRAAIRFQRPDRVPVVPQAHVWTLAHYGSSAEACLNNGGLYAELQIRGYREFGWDGVFVATDSVALAESLGVPVEHAEEGPVPGSRGLLEDLREIARLKIPDPRETRLSAWIEATRLLVREIGKEALIVARADQGPFSLACQIRGMLDFMTELGEGKKPDEIHRLLKVSTEYVWKFAELLLAEGAHVVSIGDALASGSLISPAMYEEFSFPYQQEIARRVRSRGGILSIHVCGQTTGIMARLAATGAGIIEFDAPTDFDTGWKAVAGRACLLGNVETSEVLTFGTPSMVETECRRRIERGANGGLILSSGCALSANTPAENIRAMIHAARN